MGEIGYGTANQISYQTSIMMQRDGGSDTFDHCGQDL